MKLYTYFQSSASYRVRIALGLKGLEAEKEYVNLVKGEHLNAKYEAVNPQKLLPALIDKGQILGQSLAILEYLEETYPTPALLPKAPFARAQARSLSLIIACETAPIGNLKVRKYLAEPLKLAQDAIDEWMRHWIGVGLMAYEAMLAQSSETGKFSVGDTPGMADCCLIPQIYNANRWKCSLEPFPLIRRITEACEAHPAFVAAHPKAQPDAT